MNTGIQHLLDSLILPLNVVLVIFAILVMVIRNNDFLYFAIYIVITIIMEPICYYLASKGANNLFLFHILMPTQFFLFGMTFRKWETTYRELYTSVIGVVSILLFIDCFYLTDWSVLPTNSLVWGSLGLAILSGRSLLTADKENLDKFLISIGAFMYFSINVYIYPNILITKFAVQIRIYITILTYLAYIGGLFYAWKRNR